MANKTIGQLNSKTTPASADVFVLEDTEDTKKINYDALADAVLNKITSKNYTVAGSSQTLINAINTLNSNLMTAKSWTQFTQPTLENGTHYGTHGCQYARFGSFVVVIISVAFNDPPTNAKLWTMPSGYKPVGVVEVPASGGGSYNAKAQCTIMDNGDVRVTSVDKWVAGQGIFICGG